MPAVIEVENLVQEVRKKVVLNKISFEIFSGECFGLFGARNSGKTTLLHILAGIDKFKAGSVKILGHDIKKTGTYKAKLGLVTQEHSLFKDLKVYENLEFIAALKNADKKNIFPIIEQFELKEHLNVPVSTLEEGIYQRTAMACALLNSPAVLIVDELIDYIDLYSQYLILRELKNFTDRGGSCIWAFRKIDFCDHTQRTGWLDNGHLKIHNPSELKHKWQELIESFGVKW